MRMRVLTVAVLVACSGPRPRPPKGEVVVSFEGTGKTVAELDAALRDRGIFGGKDLSGEFPELGQSALYCVTEIHTRADIDRLVDALGEAIG